MIFKWNLFATKNWMESSFRKTSHIGPLCIRMTVCSIIKIIWVSLSLCVFFFTNKASCSAACYLSYAISNSIKDHDIWQLSLDDDRFRVGVIVSCKWTINFDNLGHFILCGWGWQIMTSSYSRFTNHNVTVFKICYYKLNPIFLKKGIDVCSF